MNVPALELNTQRMRANYATSIFYACLATFVVILRLCCKISFRHQRLGLDDYFIVAAWIFCIGMCTSNIVEIVYGGLGRHIEDVPPENLEVLLKGIVIFQIMWGLSLVFVKTSFLQFFSQIFSVVKTRPVFKIAQGIVVLWGLGSVLTPLLLCQPFAFNWNNKIPGGKCGNRPLSYILVGAFHIVTDFIVLTIPIPFLWKLHMVKSRKITLIFIFSLGFACCIVSLVRITELVQVTYTDIPYSLVPGCYWTLLEPPFAILIASLPAMTPLIDRLFTRLGIRIRKSSNDPGSYPGNSFVKINTGIDKSEYTMSNLSATHDRSIYLHQQNEIQDPQYGRTENLMDDKLNMQSSKTTPYKPGKAITATTTITQTTKSYRPGSIKGPDDLLINKNYEYQVPITEDSRAPSDAQNSLSISM